MTQADYFHRRNFCLTFVFETLDISSSKAEGGDLTTFTEILNLLSQLVRTARYTCGQNIKTKDYKDPDIVAGGFSVHNLFIYVLEIGCCL